MESWGKQEIKNIYLQVSLDPELVQYYITHKDAYPNLEIATKGALENIPQITANILSMTSLENIHKKNEDIPNYEEDLKKNKELLFSILTFIKSDTSYIQDIIDDYNIYSTDITKRQFETKFDLSKINIKRSIFTGNDRDFFDEIRELGGDPQILHLDIDETTVSGHKSLINHLKEKCYISDQKYIDETQIYLRNTDTWMNSTKNPPPPVRLHMEISDIQLDVYLENVHLFDISSTTELGKLIILCVLDQYRGQKSILELLPQV